MLDDLFSWSADTGTKIDPVFWPMTDEELAGSALDIHETCRRVSRLGGGRSGDSDVEDAIDELQRIERMRHRFKLAFLSMLKTARTYGRDAGVPVHVLRRMPQPAVWRVVELLDDSVRR